ncbi:hypothetical protein LJK88_46430 [Paenibacillus sp. P26]|nr:hypothetical protein LJK88_46430 [Paenibacillus sp. P26]
MEHAEGRTVPVRRENPGSGGRTRSFWRKFALDLKRDKSLYLLALPGVVFFLIFKYVPMWGVVIAFQNYSPFGGVLHSPWVGLEHFRRFFQTEDFWSLLRNTLGINVLSLVFFFPVPIVVSLMLNELRNAVYKRIVQSVIYLPHFLSWVIIAGLTFALFAKGEGLVNHLLEAAGLERIDVLTNPDTFWIMVTVQSMWKEAGWGPSCSLRPLPERTRKSTRRRAWTGRAGSAKCGTLRFRRSEA